MHEAEIAKELDRIWNKSSTRNWIPARLGRGEYGEEIDVPGREGYVYVRMGEEGEDGVTVARDRVGVAAVGLQKVQLRRELGELVIRAASAVAGGGGGSSTLAGLSDVTLSGLADGHTLLYNSSISKWYNAPDGSGGGDTYTAGEAINISLANAISVKRESDGAIGIGGTDGLKVNAGQGLQIVGNTLTQSWTLDPGLEYGSGGEATKMRVKVGLGISRDSTGVRLHLATVSGLQLDSSGLALPDALAGDGLAISASKILSITAGNGITVTVDGVEVKLPTNSGLVKDSSGLYLGTPSDVSINSDNTVGTNTHSHNVVTMDNVGVSPQAAILASDSSGRLTLTQLTLWGNLVFTGGDRSITASNNLTIAPNTDLTLDPVNGLIILPKSQEMKSPDFVDLPTGIQGFRFWDRNNPLDPASYRQMTLGALKADEMYVRVFVADEVRIDRGEEYWSKSYGVVEEDFTLPADEANVDVWFENAPALAGANLFSVGDWLLARVVEWDTGLVVAKIWFTVVSLLTAGTVDGYRQRWRLKLEDKGIAPASFVVKKGITMLDTGVVGQGWVHLSALKQDGGPFIQVGQMTSISGDTPLFTNFARFGNLNGTVDYTQDTWGVVAGKAGTTGIASTPSSGFSGFTVDGNVGLRLFNTELRLYSGTSLAVLIAQTQGLAIAQSSSQGDALRSITWHSSLDPMGAVATGFYSYDETSSQRRTLFITTNSKPSAGETSRIIFTAADQDSDSTFSIESNDLIEFNTGIVRSSGKMLIGALGTPTSTLQIYENTANTGDAGGLTIEQDGASGDALLQFLLTAATRYRMGLDNDDGDKLKLSAGTHLGDNPIFATDNVTFNLSRPTVISANSSTNSTLRLTQDGTAVAFSARGNSTSSDMEFEVSGQATKAYFALYTGGTAQLAVNRRITGVFSNTGAAAANINLNAGNGDSSIVFYTSPTNNTNPAEAMRIDKNGRIGIGTATPVALQAGSRLTIEDSDSLPLYAAIINTGSGQAGLVLQRTGGTATSWISYIPSATTHLSFYNSTLNNSAMTLTANGDVGIGIGVTPSATLHVRESSVSGADYTADEVVVVERNGHTHLNLISGTSNQGGVMFSDDVRAMGGVFYLHSTNALYLYVNAASRLHIDSSGWVGIGTSAPGAKLTVSNDLSQAIETIWMNSYGTSNAPVLTGRHSRGTAVAPTAAQFGDLLLSLGGAGRYDSSNYHGPSATIRVIAAENFTSVNRGAYLQFRVTPTGNNSPFIAFEIQQDGQLFASHPYENSISGGLRPLSITSLGIIGYNPSSARFKRDIRDLPERLQEVFIKKLQPILYKGKDDPDDDRYDQLGFIAESVEAAGGKELVSFGKDGQADMLFYDRMIVPMVAVMQRLMARVDELERKLAAVN